MKDLLLLICLIFLFGCKKDNKQNSDISTKFDSKTKLEIDSIINLINSLDIYYKLIVQDKQSTYKYNWISPSDNQGIGPFHKIVTDSYDFTVCVLDSKNNYDTLKYTYDYCDKI